MSGFLPGAVSVAFMAAAGLMTVCAVANEPPYLQEAVTAGDLPPLSQRLPNPPLVMDQTMNNIRPGRYGGTMRMLMGKDKDIRRMMVFGYARLVGYNHRLELVPDIVEAFENVENRRFTFRLRRNHRWSDGAPFTSADFAFYWQDVANNEDVYPFGPPKSLLVDGQPPQVEFPDEHTVIYSWQNPNPYFLPALAGPRPLFIYQPRHYLQQFHPRYANREELDAKARERGSRNWAGQFLKKARQYRLSNPELPSLQPWVNTVKPPAEQYIFRRNPYFHRLDINGLQMPYIDEVRMSIVSGSLIPAKTGAGESDLQGHYIRLDNYTFLKEGEQRHDFRVLLWSTVNGAHKALYPNLNSSDPVWRELVRDVRFRRALSMGINRHEINQVIYYGLANEGNNTVLPGNDFHSSQLQDRWAYYAPEQANALLDEMGLTQRNRQGLRLRPDGEPLQVVVHTAGESTEETDMLELIHDSWLKLGIKMFTRPSQREVFRERIFSGDAMMSIWGGLENGMPTAEMSPHELAPTSQNQYQWPKWGQFNDTRGEAGEAPDMASARDLLAMNEAWRKSTDRGERGRIWATMLKTYTDEVFSIGIINSVPQPIIAHSELVNVPEQGMYSWSPTAFFGVYHPDIFWFDRP